MNWQLTATPPEARRNVVHVIPCDDLIEHTEGFGTCACGPMVAAVDDHGWLITHHSLDGREAYE